MALNSYYDDIVGIADSLIEEYQGRYGNVNIIISETQTGKVDSIRYFKDLLSMIDKYTAELFTDTNILNSIDEVKSLISSTLYKLENLK